MDDSHEKDNVVPLKFNFGEEAVPYASEHNVQNETEDSNGGFSAVVNEAAVIEDRLIVDTRIKLLPMLTYHWPLVSTKPEQVSTTSVADSKPGPSGEKKSTRKLVRRADVDMSQGGRKNRLAEKRRSFMTDSVIPVKRRRMISELYKYNFLVSQNFFLPVTPQLSSWEKLMMMKIVLNSSVFSSPDLGVPGLSSTSSPSLPTLSITYDWPVLPYQPCTAVPCPCPPPASTDTAEQRVDDINSRNIHLPVSSLPSCGADRKMTRKLVKRGEVDMSRDERKERLAVKRSLITDSGIPVKRRKLFSISYEYDCYLSPRNLFLPVTPQLSCWERLVKMKLLLSSSVLDIPEIQVPKSCVQKPQYPPLPSIAYNWPIMPYQPSTAVFSQKQGLRLNAELFLPVGSFPIPPVSLLQSNKGGQKRQAATHSEEEGTSKRLKMDTSSPVWTVALYKPHPVYGYLVDRSPAIRSIDLMYPRNRGVSDTQDVWIGRKRARCLGQPEEISKPKRSKPNPSPPCWPIAIIHTPSKMLNSTTTPAQISSVRLHINLPSLNPSSLLPPLAVIWPLIPYKDLGSVKKAFSPARPIHTSWPLVPYQAASEVKKQQRNFDAPEPSSKKIKLNCCAVPGNDEMCLGLVLDVLDSVSVKSLLKQVMKSKMKKFRVSCENRPQLNQLF